MTNVKEKVHSLEAINKKRVKSEGEDSVYRE